MKSDLEWLISMIDRTIRDTTINDSHKIERIKTLVKHLKDDLGMAS